MDWRGYFTFDGLMQWRQASNAKLVGVVVLCTVFFMIALGIYLIRKAFLYVQRRTVEEWRPTLSYRRPAIGLIVGTIVALFAFHIYANPVVGNTNTATNNANTYVVNTSQTTQDMGTTPYVAPTTEVSIVTRIAPTHTATPKPKPTVAPTKAPIPTQTRPTPTPQPQPTQSTGINNNQWGYNFFQGNLIYYPPSNFCAYFPCIASFWEKDDPGDGYVVECNDGMYSQSGGERGACSYHGGVLRPLYSH